MKYIKLSTWIDPQNVFVTLFAEAENVYWLDSSMQNDASRFSYMGIPKEIISYSLSNNSQNIFSYLNEKLTLKTVNTDLPFDFVGGYVGYFGYELKQLLGADVKHVSHYPDSLWYYSENVIVFDHHLKEIYLLSHCDDKNWFKAISKQLVNVPIHKKIAANSLEKVTFQLSRNHDQYIKDIETCKRYLTSGESYQICLTNNIRTNLDIDSIELYQRLRKNNPAPFSLYLKYGDLAILSSSPEKFLSIKDRMIETKPIKGTINRSSDLEEDARLMKKLQTNKKEWSENAMIVDLLRNDLGKVCEFGSVKVSKLMDVETYATVHQLVSTIKGKLRNDVTIIDCIKACFPGGSMTGVPKIRTMEIIDTLETEARGIYSGALGFLSLNERATLNIAIRTIVVAKKSISIGAGGAIVSDSNPEKEYDEMILKAKVLLESITHTVNAKTYSVVGDRKMHKVFLALGSNVGNKEENIHKAIKLLSQNIKDISVANIYESAPMYFKDQDIFNNTVMSGHTKLSPEELLTFVKKLETEIGRIKRFANGPREIDIDILFYDDLVYKQKQLEIPHKRISEREFVLRPFMDLEPAFIHPVLKKPMRKLYDELKAN